jgi:endonuclease/exonuclease/phosphatase family metal-dependent hydrolase
MTDIRVLTLNIWNRLGPWDERLRAIRATLELERPDIIGLQEVITTPLGDALDQGKAIAEGLGYGVAFGASHGEGFSFGNAVLSRWPIKESAVTPLPGGEGSEPRSVLYACVDSPVGDLAVFVTHLAWRFHEGAVRQAQAVAVAAEVGARTSRLGAGAPPALLLGDFNAESDSDEVRYLKGQTTLGQGRCVYFADAFAVAGGGSRGDTFSKSNPFAATLREPDRRIDYVFVQRHNDDVRGEPIDARVCFDRPVDGVFPSDHFGVLATLRY